MRERLQLWSAYLRQRGVTVLFGGLGEGAGFGGGGSLTLGEGKNQSLQLLGRATMKRYQI